MSRILTHENATADFSFLATALLRAGSPAALHEQALVDPTLSRLAPYIAKAASSTDADVGLGLLFDHSQGFLEELPGSAIDIIGRNAMLAPPREVMAEMRKMGKIK